MTQTICKPFEHFLITLFNLKNFLDGSNQESIWRNWTEERIILFKNYCLPSIVNQTNSNFRWLLFFDASTPEELKKQVLSLTKNYNFIEIIFANGFDGFLERYINDLKTRCKSKWILQTRFDNDDILHESAIDIIQSKFRPVNKTFINLSSGYTFEQNSSFLSHYYYSMGPFLSLIEDRETEMVGIYKLNHWKWPGLKMGIIKELKKKLNLIDDNIIFYLKEPLWIQLIHKKNMHNTANRGFPVFRQIDLYPFHTPLKMRKSNLYRIFNHIHYVWWKRYLKAKIINLFA